MDQLATLEFALDELRRVVVSLDDSEMETVTNCEPWTVRRLASHTLNNQLFWASIVTGEPVVTPEHVMTAVPHEGDLADLANEARDRALATWGAAGVLDGTYETPFGALPGSTVILFPTVDTLATRGTFPRRCRAPSSSRPRRCQRSLPSSGRRAPTAPGPRV